MHINIVRTENIDLTDSLHDYLEKKLQKVADKFIDKNDESAQCDVELSKTTEHHQSGPYYRAEFNLHIAGKDLFAASDQEDLYVAIDDARDEIERQLRRHREKQETRLKKGGRKLKRMLRGE